MICGLDAVSLQIVARNTILKPLSEKDRRYKGSKLRPPLNPA
jgi:hypothetical protein